MKYRKKPLVIEAIQWTGDNFQDVMLFAAGASIAHDFVDDVITIPTLEGQMEASKGDWIIKGIVGEFYPCKPNVFRDSYDLVGPTESTPVDGGSTLH